jgi:peptide/nickel transport system ATP-binding protein
MTQSQELAEPEAVLKVRDLKVTFHTYAGDVKALDGVELSVWKGELLGIVGESGCGKSVTCLAIVGLLPHNAEIISGEVILDGNNILKANKDEMRRIRLSEVAIVFQDPMTYLNPVLTIGTQLTEIIRAGPKIFSPILLRTRLDQLDAEGGTSLGPELASERQKLLSLEKSGESLSGRELNRLAKIYAISILNAVRLPEPEKIFDMYPFELSGGMRQRAMIAMALMRKPKLLLADEITTALDVTVQAQILLLLKELKKVMDTSVLLITHDLAIVAEVCDRVAVMYAGNVVEVASATELFANPLHPYTKGLLVSVPRVDMVKEPVSIGGSVPDLTSPPSGCRFHPRCPYAMEKCQLQKPSQVEINPGHFVSCYLYE